MTTNNNGYIALSLVLTVIMVGLIATASLSFLSIGEAQTSLSHLKGEEAFWFVEGCAEDGLRLSFLRHYYAGGTITRPEGTCQLTIDKAGTTWTLTTSSGATAYNRSLRITFTRTAAGITLQKWEEI